VVVYLGVTVHRAPVIIAAELGWAVAPALGRLGGCAWSRYRSVGVVAHDVISRRLRFESVR
jgi:hypothetical protein